MYVINYFFVLKNLGGNNDNALTISLANISESESHSVSDGQTTTFQRT